MRYTSIPLIFLLFSAMASAFQDGDLDGVADQFDRCPNTPFDELVNKQGCAVNEQAKKPYHPYWGALTLKIGNTFRTDEEYDDENYLNLYANYRYRKWDLSISNAQLTTKSSNTEDNSDSDSDIYISTGYTFALPKSNLKLSVGSKIVDDTTSSTEVTSRLQGSGRFSQSVTQETTSTSDESRDNDYFASMNYNYRLSPKHDLFAYYGYTISGDSDTVDYEDYSSFSLGTGYAISSNFYTALSYNYTGSIYPDGEAEEGITWFNSYRFSKNVFATASYTYAIDDYSYDNSLALALGFYFQ